MVEFINMWQRTKNFSLRTKFGIAFVALNLILVSFIVFQIYNGGKIFGLDSHVLIELLAPGILSGLFAMASLEHSGIGIAIIVMAIPVSISVVKSFVIGWAFGFLYEALRKKNLQILFFVIVALIIFFGGRFLVEKSISTEEVLRTAKTAEDCNRHAQSLGYHAPLCFYGLAIKTEDVRVCDNLKEYDKKWGNNTMGGCYSDFAMSQQRPDICDIIESNQSKFDCYRYFNLCEKMAKINSDDKVSIDSCWISRAGRESNTDYCRNVKDGARLKECSCKVQYGEFNYTEIRLCEKAN